MQKPLMRIPYTGPLPAPLIIPRSASTVTGAAKALAAFLSAPASLYLRGANCDRNDQTVLLTGAGISVASGLADYRGDNGTYRQNKSYRPIYYNEFVSSHEARKRYWARSFLGWNSLDKAKPNAGHYAIEELGRKELISSVITQNVDSFHTKAHPNIPILELHGFLRALVCINCKQYLPRNDFQQSLSKLNPAWEAFLGELLRTGALDTENPAERRKRGYRTNPDGDADVPGAPYTTFRYPACPKCLSNPPVLADGTKSRVEIDTDGAWSPTSTAGILKPNVIMFGESIPEEVKKAAEEAIDEAGRILIVGSSLATYSAWRLVKRAYDRAMPIGILNLGGVRKEENFFTNSEGQINSEMQENVRCSQPAEEVLPAVNKLLT
ncbi:MAG: hypothetical protein Q9227_005144 [Pyrenula ochraceoflavens]